MVVVGAVFLNIVLGGSGLAAPLLEAGLQVLLAALAVAWLWAASGDRLRSIPHSVWVIAALVVMVPLAQLVPLPPAFWHGLPGRGIEVQALALIGQDQSWRPISMAPNLTLSALMSMVAALILLVMVASLRLGGRSLVLGAVVGVGLLSLLVGAGQVGGGDGVIFRFFDPGYGYLAGFQNNRNSESDILLIAMVCSAALIRDMALTGLLPDRRRLVLGAAVCMSMLFSLGIVLTGSRTGMVLISAAILAQAVLLKPWLGLGARHLTLVLVAGLLIAGALVYALQDNAMITHALGRFRTTTEFRPEIWQDTRFAIANYFPWGSGMGTFVPAFMAGERLEIVSATYSNRAHNDYLELLLEAGIGGSLVFGVVTTLVLNGAFRGLFRSGPRISGQVFCAISVLSIIAVHSIVDYPLRSMSLGGMAAVFAAFLLNPRGAGPKNLVKCPKPVE
jgi:hypothetical protein